MRSPEEQAKWLSSVIEPVLEPDRRIIDPHHHFWKGHTKFGGPYLLDDLWADTAQGHQIEATVFIQCGVEYRPDGPTHLRPIGETEFVAAIAKQSETSDTSANRPPVAGIVAHADLRRGAAVAEVLEAQIAAGHGLVKGIRHTTATHDDPAVLAWTRRINPNLMMEPDFRSGFAELSSFGLSFDSWLCHPQIPQLTDLARAFPDINIVLDHFGGPIGVGQFRGHRADIFEQWRKDITELARCSNVFAKLGGLAMPLNGFDWHERSKPATSDELVAAHRDYYLHTIDQFGPQRCMFESNFPVDKLSVSYPIYWNAAKKIAAGFSDAEKNQMFYANAARVYQLDR